MSGLTKPSSFNRNDLTQLFNLDPSTIESLDVSHVSEEVYVHITLVRDTLSCPVCETQTNRIKGYTEKKILHSLLTNYPCFINYRARRYVCPTCNKTFYEHNPFSHQNMKISVLTVSNVLQDLKSATETFSSVSRRYGLSPTTVAALFDSHVFISRKKLPEYICIDECYAFSGGYGDYVCSFVDFISKDVVDLLPSRKKEDLERYFDRIPLEERKNVKMISIDMWETYRIVAKKKLPNCLVAVDKFHILQLLHSKLKRVRTTTMNRLKPPKISDQLKEDALIKKIPEAMKKHNDYIKRDKQYYVFKKYDWLLYMNDEKQKKLLDYDHKRKYNNKLNRWCNYRELLNMMFDNQPKLEEMYNYLQRFDIFYRTCKHDNAKEEVDKLINIALQSDIIELIEFGNTIRKWKKEIINSFIIVETKMITVPLRDKVGNKLKGKDGKILTEKIERHRKMNNGVIEGRNKILKQLKHNSNGYKNWERYRNRAMYVINQDATYYLNPMEGK